MHSGEIGIIGRAQDASHYYRLSLKRDPSRETRNGGSRESTAASSPCSRLASSTFQSGYYYLLKLTFYKQHIQASISFDQGLTFNSLGFAEDTRYRRGKIGLMTRTRKASSTMWR